MRKELKKKEWQSFMGYIQDNPEALMSMVITPLEPSEIINSITVPASMP
jgi:hypothetical protein